MLPNRLLLLATACALPLSLVACGGGDDGGGAAGPPTGTHYGYVVNKANVAPTTQQGHTYLDYGLDLGSVDGTKLDGKVDNGIGQALGALSAFFDVQGTVDTAINTGAIILLIDFQTESFSSAATSGLTVKFGDNPNPPACANAQDTVCGGHLKGGATIAIAGDSPSDASLTGKVVNGVFNSDSGNVGLAIAIGDAATPVSLNLIHARVQASSITTDGIATAKVGGLITQTELQTNIAPAILTSVTNLLTAAGCNKNGDPKATPACGCTAPTTATGIILSQIDGDTGDAKNCQITAQELLSFAPVQTVLKPDSCSTDKCTAADSYSIGVQVTAVKATIQ